MIEEFSFGNFWSFKDIQTLNMAAAKIKSKDDSLDLNNVFSVKKDVDLIKSKAIYGANASGKSNVVKALVAFIRILKESVINEKALSLIDPFELSTETVNQPTFFQLIFHIGKTKYRYGFEADNKSIKSEWLYATPNIREQVLFIRENNKIIEINKTHFEEGILYQNLFGNSHPQLFTDTSLFLTNLNLTGFANLSKKIFKAISSISVVSGLGHSGMYSLAGDSLSDAIIKKFILDFLKNGDIGISNLETVEIPNENVPTTNGEEVKKGKYIISSRTKFDSDFQPAGKSDFAFGIQESEGTKKMFELSPFIYKALKEGNPLIIDEFDSRFHPLLTRKIVELFNSCENTKSQLIFTTHDTNLLSPDLLRRDQIDFVEKDKYGASHLYTLVEIKGVRNDASFEKDYIQGKYGAIPYLRNLNHLIYSE